MYSSRGCHFAASISETSAVYCKQYDVQQPQERRHSKEQRYTLQGWAPPQMFRIRLQRCVYIVGVMFAVTVVSAKEVAQPAKTAHAIPLVENYST